MSLLQETITSQSTAPSVAGFIQQHHGSNPVRHNNAAAQPTNAQPQTQAINGRSGVMPVLPSMVNFEADRQKLQQQIEELNHRHQEAQVKLQQFFHQQQQPRQQQQQQPRQQQVPPQQQRVSSVQQRKLSLDQQSQVT